MWCYMRKEEIDTCDGYWKGKKCGYATAHCYIVVNEDKGEREKTDNSDKEKGAAKP